jgi:integrase
MGVDDPQQFAEQFQREREKLAAAPIPDADRDAIETWMRRKSGTVADSSLTTYLRRLRVASERAPAPLMELTPDSYQELIFALRHEHELADSTLRSYENAVLPFVEDMTGAEWAEDVERTRVERETLDASQVLTPADIGRLTETARHQRDVAFIEFLADTGARLSLALSLRTSDVQLDKPPTYTPNPNATGLKGAAVQEYPLIDSVGIIRSYLRTSHPRPNDPDVALFHKIKPASRNGNGRWSDDGAVRANAIRQQVQRIADRAGVDKPVNPHAFRHAAISRMAREGYSRSQIEHRVHWTLDSDMWETYEHISSAEHNTDIFRSVGLVDADAGPERTRRPCGQCRSPLAPHHEFCPNCGEPATAAAEASVDADEDRLLDLLTETTNPTTRRELRALLAEIDERPDLAHDDPS